jgi:hypothetical protein
MMDMLHLHKRWKRTARGASKEYESPVPTDILSRASGLPEGPLCGTLYGATWLPSTRMLQLTFVTIKS